MTPPYTVDYFIQKFEAIPDEKWTTGTYTRCEYKHCALGHCGTEIIEKPRLFFKTKFTPEGKALENLFKIHFPESITRINDGEVDQYQQPTPKARILAALRDIQKKQEKI
jgi:hypothetical protein